MIALHALAALLAAALVFVVQPMEAKRLLPTLGGSPAVWTAAMLLFQVLLLAGYAAAHGLGIVVRRSTKPRVVEALAFIGGLGVAAILALFVRPIGLDALRDRLPTLWVLASIATSIGLAFIVLAAAGPTIQRWFAASGHAHARDPYFLYAASNLGSMIGLLGYPFIVEPALDLGAQRTWWIAGLGVLAIASALCLLAGGGRTPPAPATRENGSTNTIMWRQRFTWAGLAAAGSSLMLGATAHLTTDIAAVPLLWVVPLAVYLLSFTIAFAPRVRPPIGPTGRVTVMLVVAVAAAMLLGAKRPLPIVAGLHLALLAVGTLVCHTRLALDRPPPARLTEFYLWIAAGGACGGLINAVLAPVLFNTTLEYPLAIAAVAGIAAASSRHAKPTMQARPRLIAALGCVAGVVLVAWMLGVRHQLAPGSPLFNALVVGVPAVALFVLSSRASLLTPAAAMVLAFAVLAPVRVGSTVLERSRTFFGVHRVEQRDDAALGPVRTLLHGATVHGVQAVRPDEADTPRGYYHPDGPLGDIFTAMQARSPNVRTGAIGMGIGAVAAYARDTDTTTFVELDPDIVRIARDPNLFTHLAHTHGTLTVYTGDGRLVMTHLHAGEHFDLLILDAFSSDAVPAHLLTLEAFGVWLDRLAPGGVLAVHISNQHLDLERLIAGTANELGLAARVKSAAVHTNDLAGEGADLLTESTWAVLARSEADLADIADRPGWLRPRAEPVVWTDRRADLLSVLAPQF